MLENRARFVAERGEQLIQEGDSYLARLLAITILPEDLKNPDKPYTIEAEGLLRNALKYNSGILYVHRYSIESASFSPDGTKIVSASGDYTIRIWGFPPLQELIDKTRERFKDRELTPEERRKFYLE